MPLLNVYSISNMDLFDANEYKHLLGSIDINVYSVKYTYFTTPSAVSFDIVCKCRLMRAKLQIAISIRITLEIFTPNTVKVQSSECESFRNYYYASQRVIGNRVKCG